MAKPCESPAAIWQAPLAGQHHPDCQHAHGERGQMGLRQLLNKLQERRHDPVRLHRKAKGSPHTSPPTDSKPISSAYAIAVGNATAATDTPATASCRSHSRRYPNKFRSPGATRRTEGIFLRALDDFSIYHHGKLAAATSSRSVGNSSASPGSGSFTSARRWRDRFAFE